MLRDDVDMKTMSFNLVAGRSLKVRDGRYYFVEDDPHNNESEQLGIAEYRISYKAGLPAKALRKQHESAPHSRDIHLGLNAERPMQRTP